MDEFIRNKECYIDRGLCIALNPSSRAYCKGKGLTMVSTLSYFSNQSHSSSSSISKTMYDWLRRNIKLADMNFKTNTAYTDIMLLHTRVAINYYLFILEIISNSYHSHKPHILCASLLGKSYKSKHYIPRLKRFFTQRLYMRPEEKNMARLVKYFAITKGIKFEDISGKSADVSRLETSTKLTERLVSLILSGFISFGTRTKRFLRLIKLKSTSDPVLFFTTATPYMKKITKDLKREKQFDSYFLHEYLMPAFKNLSSARNFTGKLSNIFTMQKKLFLNLTEKIRSEKALFSYKGISFAGLLADKFHNDIAPYILGLLIWTGELNQIIKSINPALLLSSGNRHDDLITAGLCRQMDIPTVFISHGSFVYPKNEIERVEWGEQGRHFLRAPFSHLALQTPLSEGYLKAFPSDARTIKSGPLVWGMPVKADRRSICFKKVFGEKPKFEDAKVVLHAGSPKQNFDLKFHIYETPDEYIQALCDLACVVQEIPNTYLVIKVRPSKEITRTALRKLVPFSERVKLIINEPFNDLLGMSNLLVSFSSTTIEEALQNNIPVLLYGGSGRYQHIPGYESKEGVPLRKAAVYYTRQAKDLKYAVSRILDLKLDRNRDSNLFSPYIYAERDKTPLAGFIKNLI